MEVSLHPTQFIVAEDKHRFRIICAGRRWGKSVLARMIMLKWAAETPGLYWIVSPTFQQGHDIHWMQGFKAELPDDVVSKWNEADLSITLKNGSVIQIKSAENPDRLKGVKLNGLVVDEIASMRNWNWIWQEALRPTLTDFEAPAVFISTPKGFNHFYDLFMQGQRESKTFKSWRFTSYDNPTIPASEIDQAKADVNEEYFNQEYMADFCKYTGLIYKDFDRDENVIEFEMDDFKPVYYLLGLDRGFTNPTAVPFVAVDKNDVWYQFAEIYQTGLTNPPLFDLLEIMVGDKEVELATMDSAQASDIQELMDISSERNSVIDFLPVKKESGETGVNYVRWKIQKFAERIKAKKYFVNPDCRYTISEFETYHWKEKKDKLATSEQPDKVDDHMMDALGDLNAMYMHWYKFDKKKSIIEGKIPGTFVPLSKPDDEESGEWDEDSSDGFWEGREI